MLRWAFTVNTKPAGTLREMQRTVRGVNMAQDMGRYILNLVAATREDTALELGASPRAALALFRGAQASAFLDGRDYAVPGDVQKVAAAVLVHRLVLTTQARYGGKSTFDVVGRVLESTKVPT